MPLSFAISSSFSISIIIFVTNSDRRDAYPTVLRAINPKSAFSPEKAGFDARKPFVLKPLEHAMLQSLPAYFYATQIMQIAA